MNLNQIHLNPAIVVELYKDVLIEQPESEKAGINTRVVSGNQPKPRQLYLGDYQKHIVVVLEDPMVVFIEEGDLQFLTTVLSACKLSLADIAIVNKAHLPDNNPQELFGNNPPKVALLFGISPLSIGLPINFPEFQVQQFNECIYLCAPELTQIASDKGLKGRLWTSLKNVFGI